jgi:hypothetical protein
MRRSFDIVIRAGGGEHAADDMADRDLDIGDLGSKHRARADAVQHLTVASRVGTAVVRQN